MHKGFTVYMEGSCEHVGISYQRQLSRSGSAHRVLGIGLRTLHCEVFQFLKLLRRPQNWADFLLKVVSSSRLF
jgi:hypothetical protein